MRERDAARMTRYFGAGVHAHIWCYAGDGDWAISIRRREGAVCFYSLDETLRAIQGLKQRIESGEAPRVLGREIDDEVEFYDSESAWQCAVEVSLAIAFIQSVSADSRWHPVPPNLFDRPPAPVVREIVSEDR